MKQPVTVETLQKDLAIMILAGVVCLAAILFLDMDRTIKMHKLQERIEQLEKRCPECLSRTWDK